MEDKDGRFGPFRWQLLAEVAVGALLTTGFHSTIVAQGNQRYFNGTEYFSPTVVLISFDGFRADYLDRGLTPHLTNIVHEGGFQAEYLIPSFPSSTFPNHYSIVTGLYPGSHGIVSNIFDDPDTGHTFHHKDKKCQQRSEWWGGEPIWVTAELHGQKTAVDMWAGVEAPIKGKRATYSESFDRVVTPKDKVDRILTWLDLPNSDRPTFVASYFSEIDRAGHHFSPDSDQVNNELRQADAAVSYLQEQLRKRNLHDIVNVIYLSDHGMAPVGSDSFLVVNELVDESRFEAIEGLPLGLLFPKNYNDTQAIYNELEEKHRSLSKNGVHVPWKVYLKADLPSRFHYSTHGRIAPIILLPNPGYIFIRKQDFEARHKKVIQGEKVAYGTHGYDNLDKTMRAIFLAHGPDFRLSQSTLWAHDKGRFLDVIPTFTPQGGESIPKEVAQPVKLHPAFTNTEVYGLICQILGFPPAPNDGTLNWEYTTSTA
ncbi:hypothetical protein IWQ62_002777 [Dispira parvispora]|uniref:Uncharacterized protein n=1 Tax=Dispira parvispora TaxID=1520584 RepID=A0A9W8E753_9FUNG|nr:hypothetical protein IWQ62_002777 [Dispira parvispora]